MFRRREPAAAVVVLADIPYRTRVTLTREHPSVNLWSIARAVERRMLEMDRADPLPWRPPVGTAGLVGLSTYSWSWDGDEVLWLLTACEDIAGFTPGFRFTVELSGGPTQELATPAAVPPPRPQTEMEELAELFDDGAEAQGDEQD